MTVKERVSEIIQKWFLSESALFQIICSHELIENTSISCPVRCGKGRIEFNPLFLENMSDNAIDESLRTEAIRIRHPYQRKPDQCCDQAIAIGSNVTIGDNYTYGAFSIETPKDYDLDKGMPYEWYSRRIQEILPPSGGEEKGDGGSGGKDDTDNQSSPGGKSKKFPKSFGKGRTDDFEKRQQRDNDLSELWDEDDLMVSKINGIIDSIKDWGSIHGSFLEMLKASTKAKINWRKVFYGFRSSILSSRKRLTRMRPSRRYGFEAMGNTREYDTKLLIAVDVSGSITSESLSYFYGVVNSAFKFGFESVDVLQFDCGISTVQTLKKTIKDVTILGRGGTSFQEPVDYAIEHRYDGLIILTDGYAPEPVIPVGKKLEMLWVCESKQSYEAHHSWMEKLGRVCIMELK